MSTKADDPRRTSTGGVTPGLEDAPAPGPEKEDGQHSSYWVLTEAERAKGFVRPVRMKYVHDTCGTVTQMSDRIAETYARDPQFYGSTFCMACKDHLPVGEFRWDDADGERLGS